MQQTREGDGRMKLRVLWKDEQGDAVVEATILFPIIMMIFAGLMLLAKLSRGQNWQQTMW